MNEYEHAFPGLLSSSMLLQITTLAWSRPDQKRPAATPATAALPAQCPAPTNLPPSQTPGMEPASGTPYPTARLTLRSLMHTEFVWALRATAA